LSVLDIGAGGGDVPLDLIERCRRRGLELEVLACDSSPTALRIAAAAAAKRRLAGQFSTSCLDVLSDPLPEGRDVALSTLFLHHLDEDQAQALLARMAAVAGSGVVVCDLLRSRVGLALAFVASRAVTRSPIVHADALASVRQAFSFAEVRQLLQYAGLEGRLSWIWPWRFRLEIDT
jgi:2-polyprenyl-3-methyl-5-hydroxy-6-metoxy-1,4-benzoquinol methylase